MRKISIVVLISEGTNPNIEMNLKKKTLVYQFQESSTKSKTSSRPSETGRVPMTQEAFPRCIAIDMF